MSNHNVLSVGSNTDFAAQLYTGITQWLLL